jgi:Domain of unknown function (DUF1834)
MHDTTSIEDNIIARITSQCPEFRIVESMGDITVIERALKTPPSALVVFESESYEDTNLIEPIYQDARMTWQIYIITNSMRDPKGARKGPEGSYKLGDKVKAALLGYDPVHNRIDQPDFPIQLVSTNQFNNEDDDSYIWLLRVHHPVDTNG